MKILSLFDGISCAQIAAERAGIKVHGYFASEIDKHAIEVTQKNWPDTKQIGDVKTLKVKDGGIVWQGGGFTFSTKIDLLIGGSPCQDLSIAKINRKGLAGERSGLFYEYLRILRELKPRYFVLENVASMPKEARETITKEIGVEPVLIDAGLVSAQRRKRLFWTNIPLDQPADRGIFLKDVLQPEEEVDEKYYVSRETLGRLKGWKNAQSSRIHGTDGKSVTLQAGGGGTGAKTGLYAIQQRGRGKNAGNLHTEKSPTLTSNAFEQNHHVVALTETRTPEAKRIRAKAMRETGKDWSPRRGKELVPRKDEKANTLTTGQTKESLLLAGGRVRKLTPIECERLQSVPDNYTAGHADGSRYKMLGKAFNVEVIRHILSKIK